MPQISVELTKKELEQKLIPLKDYLGIHANEMELIKNSDLVSEFIYGFMIDANMHLEKYILNKGIEFVLVKEEPIKKSIFSFIKKEKVNQRWHIANTVALENIIMEFVVSRIDNLWHIFEGSTLNRQVVTGNINYYVRAAISSAAKFCETHLVDETNCDFVKRYYASYIRGSLRKGLNEWNEALEPDEIEGKPSLRDIKAIHDHIKNILDSMEEMDLKGKINIPLGTLSEWNIVLKDIT